jgi:hypothetical protein
MKKTMLWKSFCESDTLEMFVNMSEYLAEDIKPHVLTHLTNLESNFKNRFLKLTLQQHEWMRNPFAVTIGDKISHLSIKTLESLMELSCDTSLKIKFEALSLPEFWIYMKKNTWELSQLATEVLLHFGTTYLCEKKKHFQQRQQLNHSTVTAFNLKMTYEFLYRRFNRGCHLVSNMQAHPSH